MEKGKIGVQMMMLKEEIRRGGMRPAMEKLADLGYHAVEVSQIPMTPENIRELQYADQNLGIQTVSMSCGLEDLSPDYKYPGIRSPTISIRSSRTARRSTVGFCASECSHFILPSHRKK